MWQEYGASMVSTKRPVQGLRVLQDGQSMKNLLIKFAPFILPLGLLVVYIIFFYTVFGILLLIT